MTTEAALAFRQETLFNVVVKAVEEDASEDLPSDVQQENASVVVADLAVLSPHVEVDDCGVVEILRYFSLTPHHLEERCQMIHKLGATVFVDLSRDCVRCGRFPAGELLRGPQGFV
ncbi:hypothetical protein SprV_0301136200 [Sparganum proliferum]